MIRRITVSALQFGALVFSLVAFLCADGVLEASSGVIGSTFRDLSSIFRDPATQWLVLVCLVFYFIAVSIFEVRFSPGVRLWRIENSILWKCAFVALALLGYTIGYSKSSNSTVTLVVLATMVFGKGVLMWTGWRKNKLEQRPGWPMGLLVCLLTGSIFWQQKTNIGFQYHGITRWSGVWDNPNLFGLLMGASFVLSLGMGISGSRVVSCPIWKIAGMFCCGLAALLAALGLFKSLSRGAWLGTAVGLAYLVCFKLENWKSYSGSVFWNWKNGMRAAVIVFFLAALGFWQFRFIEWQPMRRAFSTANVNDFSWRNRITAWKGAIRMMERRPFFGYGWGKAEKVYGEEYRPTQMENGAAIQMNDYFMLGISIGVPALVCFLVYIGLSLRSPQSTVHSPSRTRGPDSVLEVDNFEDLDWLQATCRAGAIVLLVGFFFDGGLFKLATGSVFWILLELGRVDVYRGGVEVQRAAKTGAQDDVKTFNEPELAQNIGGGGPGVDGSSLLSRWEIWLGRGAWILGIAAVSESAILLGTPFFSVNNTTLTISRHYLVPPSAAGDLNLLAGNVDWGSRKLRPLLQHASLANYNRQLINWKLDDQIYRDCVLNPLIDPARDGQLAWRRKLWEYFYLPMRKENDPASAAQIVLKFLHQRIALVAEGPATIDEMWQEKRADERGIRALEVAALRSVGIPARLNESGRAELFSEGKWQALPEYTPSTSK
jgi:O-antigen ligase